MTIIAVTAESQPEPRVAISPDTVKKYKALGCTVRIEAGAGNRSRFSDADVGRGGCRDHAHGRTRRLQGADILLKVRRPSPQTKPRASSPVPWSPR